MSQNNSLITLKLPAPETATLSFCKPTARDMGRWLSGLPKANTGEYSRLLYQALTELNKLNAAPELRLQLLELLRPEVTLIINQLEKNHLLSAVILDVRASKVANLCQTLYFHLNMGYKGVVDSLQHKKSPTLALALQRALYGLYSSLALSLLTYRPVPTGLWHEMHQLFSLALHHGLNHQKVPDTLLAPLSGQTLEQAYVCALLMGCARANQMRQPDIKALADALPGWSRMAHLQDIQAEDSLFAVALNTDTPPRYRALLNLGGQKALLGLNPEALVRALQEGNNERVSLANIPAGLTEQLVLAWGDIAKRDFKRTASNGKLLVTLGMSAVHFYLSGQIPFEDTLDQPAAAPLQLVPETTESQPDIWSFATDVLDDDRPRDRIESYEYNQPESDEVPGIILQDLGELYPLLETGIVNQSPGGYCLEWEQDAPANLQTGDILALRNADSNNWSIATIRWIRQSTRGGAQIGVELLAARTTPCAVQLIRSGKPASNYLRALRIPEIPVLSRPAQLITPKIPFREGCSVQINVNGQEERALLTRQVKQTASCGLFEYEASRPAREAVPALAEQPLATTEAGTETDEFRSLWNTL